MDILQFPTSKFSERASGAPDMLIIHSISLRVPDALELLTVNPVEARAHYAVTPQGQVIQFVDESKKAWHAGTSFWRGRSDLNQVSIGIELISPGPRNTNRSWEDCPGPFPAKQMKALAALSRDICTRWNIAAHNVLAHSDIAPRRKRDPGELFDWKWFAYKGVGLYPKGRLPDLYRGDMTEGLAAYGYDVSRPDEALLAFRRHFGFKDSEATLRHKLAWLLAKALQP